MDVPAGRVGLVNIVYSFYSFPKLDCFRYLFTRPTSVSHLSLNFTQSFVSTKLPVTWLLHHTDRIAQKLDPSGGIDWLSGGGTRGCGARFGAQSNRERAKSLCNRRDAKLSTGPVA